ncbi:MAG: hypothetical protein ACTSVI_02685 [Promethearchaeota archaeon]
MKEKHGIDFLSLRHVSRQPRSKRVIKKSFISRINSEINYPSYWCYKSWSSIIITEHEVGHRRKIPIKVSSMTEKISFICREIIFTD